MVLYLRDINTDYLKQLDMGLSRSKGSVGMVNVNVTDGTCKSGSSSLKNLELQEEAVSYTHLDVYKRQI